MINRRQWLRGLGLALGASAHAGTQAFATPLPQTNAQESSSPGRLALADYEPKSMLQVRETRVERARFPAVDIHTHISISAKSEGGIELAPERTYLGKVEELLSVMDRKNIRAMVNLTGGFDNGVVEAVTKYDKASPGRFYTFTEPSYSKLLEPDYPRLQADAIERAHRAGRGSLSRYLREKPGRDLQRHHAFGRERRGAHADSDSGAHHVRSGQPAHRVGVLDAQGTDAAVGAVGGAAAAPDRAEHAGADSAVQVAL